MLLQQGETDTRYHLPDLLNARGMHGQAVEIGTHRGEFAKRFLDRWTSGILHCVDPWKNDEGYKDQAQYLVGGGYDREQDFRIARKVLRISHPDRYVLCRTTSASAAKGFSDGLLDLVYIDGDHTYDAVRQDLWTWWPKLRQGGYLCGHDFVCPGERHEDNWGRHIQPAVFEFATTHDLTVYLIPEREGHPWSYYFIKP